MRYPAQIQAAIDIFDSWQEKPLPLDSLMASYFKARRYIGSKDKAVIADTVYGLFRRLGEIRYLLGDQHSSARSHMAVYLTLDDQNPADIFTGDGYSPAPLSKTEQKVIDRNVFKQLKTASAHVRYNIQDWLMPHLQQAFGDDFHPEVTALHGRGPLDIRMNTLKCQSRKKLQQKLLEASFSFDFTPYSRLGLRLNARRNVFGTEAFKQGLFEVQDEGSQLIAAACMVKPGEKVVDFCAGAGGKTLALAAAMAGKGTLYACDIHEKRMRDMRTRLKRAGAADVVRQVVLSSEHDKWVKRHQNQMDAVLVDAPCSGSGTWRRSPDALWKLTADNLAELNRTQASILASAARLVRPGGVLVYATCSVLRAENHQQTEAFLANHPEFTVHPEDVETTGTQLTPASTGTDGFYLVRLVRS